MKRVILTALRGAGAGAAGTTALNVLSYVDMVARARPASTTPEATIDMFAGRSHIPLPGTDGARANREAGLAPLIGIATDTPMTVLDALDRDGRNERRHWLAPVSRVLGGRRARS